jgi:hypothetical protein
MECTVIFTAEFGSWWDDLTVREQISVAAVVGLLEQHGVTLRFPHSSRIETAKSIPMRELRVQHDGRPYRVLYAFDPLRHAILLLGGDKTGDNRWYEVHVPIAERIYAEYLSAIEEEK